MNHYCRYKQYSLHFTSHTRRVAKPVHLGEARKCSHVQQGQVGGKFMVSGRMEFGFCGCGDKTSHLCRPGTPLRAWRMCWKLDIESRAIRIPVAITGRAGTEGSIASAILAQYTHTAPPRVAATDGQHFAFVAEHVWTTTQPARHGTFNGVRFCTGSHQLTTTSHASKTLQSHVERHDCYGTHAEGALPYHHRVQEAWTALLSRLLLQELRRPMSRVGEVCGAGGDLRHQRRQVGPRMCVRNEGGGQ